MKKKKVPFNIDDYYIIRPEISIELVDKTVVEIRKYLPYFKVNCRATLIELDEFMTKKYKAQKADWKDIDKCTRTKVRIYNKYCRTVFGVSECLVNDRDYYTSYIIEREHCIHPSTNKDAFFYDMFLIAGSNDGKHFTSYYVGGRSDSFLDEMCVLSGQYLKECK